MSTCKISSAHYVLFMFRAVYGGGCFYGFICASIYQQSESALDFVLWIRFWYTKVHVLIRAMLYEAPLE